MSRLGLSPAARNDLENIWDYTAEHWNADQAEAYVRSLHGMMTALAASPCLGRSADAIRRGYMKFPVASHVLYYRKTAGGIEVIRILHKSMDVERHL